MKIKGYILIGISVAALFLVACSQDSIEDIVTSTNKLESLHGQAVDEINGLYEDELDLQYLFSETLEIDETLSSLADGSSPVFDNIESRQARLEAIEETEDQMREETDLFTSYEGEMLSRDEIEAVVSEVEAFVSSLESFRQQYGQTLSTQEEYFGAIAIEEATYDIFLDGIEEVNVEHEELQVSLIDLDNRLIDLEETISNFQRIIEDTLEESEEE